MIDHFEDWYRARRAISTVMVLLGSRYASKDRAQTAAFLRDVASFVERGGTVTEYSLMAPNP